MIPRKVLVTGGAGFIGSHVADAHIARGDRVWVLDDLSSGKQENIPAAAEFVEMDVANEQTTELIRDIGFDLINHHAAQIDVRTSVANPILDAFTNILGLLKILEGARMAGTRRIVFVSSGGVVYGEPEIYPSPESLPKEPVSPYGVSKIAGEIYLNCYREIHGLEHVALRYGNVYGPRQDPHGEAGVVAIFCNRLIEEKPLIIYGDGRQERDYVYVDDVVSANLLAADMLPSIVSGIDARAYNIGTGTGTSVNALATHLEEIAGAERNRIHRDERPGDVQRSILDPSRFRAIGWEPARSLRAGLARTFEHILEEK